MATLRIVPSVLAHMLDLPEGLEITDVAMVEDFGQPMLHVELRGDFCHGGKTTTMPAEGTVDLTFESTEEVPGVRLTNLEILPDSPASTGSEGPGTLDREPPDATKE